MEVNFTGISGTHPSAQRIADWLVDIYNSENSWQEDYMQWVKPELVSILYIENVGGIIVDTVFDSSNMNPKLICQLLCIEKEHRGRGYARELIKVIQYLAESSSTELIGAFVNFGEGEFWAKLGFPHSGASGFALTQTIRPLTEVWEQ
ncbi:GNAT family N-acetyltransferase [Photobacterium sp. BZF1]|uniref:GNAT family N-acetyltransferase n=1 Tax=Photobacterium sp. BZF1 TaxID=1904457 RepID=UPI001653A822|nr:GNAT family N-acetyltransferase [Photobacterium sp. BZF1]MBC7006795.1 GNAT family N-acetyltransferase [Photobacterium sp. BZF1]